MLIGQPIPRLDGHQKVTGGATYTAEFAMPGMVHAVLVQSTIASGRIDRYDLAAAQAMPGVLAILTVDDAERLAGSAAVPQAVMHPLLQSREIFYNGQHVAVVVADTLERATAAAAAVRVSYTATPAIADMDGQAGAAFTPKHFRGGMVPADTRLGDPDAALAAAPLKIVAQYSTPVEHHNPMEMHATIARWQDGALTVWTTTQGISGAHGTLAALFGLDPARVRVICPYVGGGFGSKGNTWPPAALAAMAARRVGRPVKLMVTRAQMFTSNGFRPRTLQTVALGAGQDGRLLAIRHDGITQTCRPEIGEFAEPVGLATRMLYAAPAIATSHRLIAVNQGLPTYMRAPGESSGMFALESAMDELAVAAGIDPVELRLRNDTQTDPTSGLPFASRALRQCYEQGAAAFGWGRRSAAPRSMQAGGMLVGWGMATATYGTNRQPAAALVRIGADGNAVVRSGTQELGTGTYTIMAQAAGDELGLPMARVRAELGDSSFPPAPVSGGSMTAASVLPAVRAAAQAARQAVFTLAVRYGGADFAALTPDRMNLADGMVTAPGASVSVGTLLARAGRDFVEAQAGAKLSPEAARYSRHAFGAQFVEVQVDPELCTLRVTRMVGAFDCGRVLNARTARSQMIGGMVFGMGMALFERTVIDAASARYVNANIADYLVPVNADVPEIEAIAVASDDPITDSYGAKGIGELPMVGVAAAIANAVYHATGKRVRDLPIRIEHLLG